MPEPNAVGFGRLLDWVEGRLSEEEARVVEEQVAASSSATREDADWLRAFARVSESITLESPPPEVYRELLDRFEAYAEGQRQPGFLQRLVAALSFDSEMRLPVADLRAASVQGSNRQLIYTTDVAEVALNLRSGASHSHLDIDGQVFLTGGGTPGSFVVQLLDGANEVDITTTDDLGMFTLLAIPPGVYEMVLSTDRAEIMITPVELHL